MAPHCCPTLPYQDSPQGKSLAPAEVLRLAPIGRRPAFYLQVLHQHQRIHEEHPHRLEGIHRASGTFPSSPTRETGLAVDENLGSAQGKKH